METRIQLYDAIPKVQIAYEPRALVYHSHRETLRARACRDFDYLLAKCTIFHRDLKPISACMRGLLECFIFSCRCVTRTSPPGVVYWAGYFFWKWILFSWMVCRRPRAAL